MRIFRKAHEKLKEELSNICEDAIFAVKNDTSLPQGLKTTFLKFLTSVAVVGDLLVTNITTSPFDFRRYVKKDVDVLNAFVGLCCMQLERLSRRDPNITLLIPPLASLLEIDEKYFRNPLEEFKKLDIDPRDLWLEQDMHFYEFILDPEFDVRRYFTEDRGNTLALSLLSQQIVISGAEAFEEASSLFE